MVLGVGALLAGQAAARHSAHGAHAAVALVLLDTSEGLAPYFKPVTQALAETATALGEKDGLVSLWNYSSPISETATGPASPKPMFWRYPTVAVSEIGEE